MKIPWARRWDWRWAVPVAMLFLYVQLAGYPVFTQLAIAFFAFTVAGIVGVLPARSLYVAGFVLLILAPIWLIASATAAIGQSFAVLQFFIFLHMADGTAMARVCADAAYVCFTSGLCGEVIRRRWTAA